MPDVTVISIKPQTLPSLKENLIIKSLREAMDEMQADESQFIIYLRDILGVKPDFSALDPRSYVLSEVILEGRRSYSAAIKSAMTATLGSPSVDGAIEVELLVQLLERISAAMLATEYNSSFEIYHRDWTSREKKIQLSPPSFSSDTEGSRELYEDELGSVRAFNQFKPVQPHFNNNFKRFLLLFQSKINSKAMALSEVTQKPKLKRKAQNIIKFTNYLSSEQHNETLASALSTSQEKILVDNIKSELISKNDFILNISNLILKNIVFRMSLCLSLKEKHWDGVKVNAGSFARNFLNITYRKLVTHFLNKTPDGKNYLAQSTSENTPGLSTNFFNHTLENEGISSYILQHIDSQDKNEHVKVLRNLYALYRQNTIYQTLFTKLSEDSPLAIWTNFFSGMININLFSTMVTNHYNNVRALTLIPSDNPLSSHSLYAYATSKQLIPENNRNAQLNIMPCTTNSAALARLQSRQVYIDFLLNVHNISQSLPNHIPDWINTERLRSFFQPPQVPRPTIPPAPPSSTLAPAG